MLTPAGWSCRLVVKSISYAKAPLLELIVEIRWQVSATGIPGGPGIISGLSAEFDLWFQELTNTLRGQGFHNLERLVPHDMPVMAHQPVYRYRLSDDPFPVVQFGHGIFTVNAGPPSYESWSSFRPRVEQVLEALIASRPDGLELDVFSRASLRYIDLFDAQLRGDASNYAFIRDGLGVVVDLPDGLLDVTADRNRISPTVALRLPVDGDEGASLAFQVAAGRLGQRPTTDTIMDMSYSVDRRIETTPESVLSALDRAYETVHAWFETLTAGLRDRMKPVAGS